MSYILISLLGLAIGLSSLFAPILMIFVTPFIVWNSSGKGSLPHWLSWFETPDEQFPGDLRIDQMRTIFDRYGKWVCSWFWGGVRNRLMGFAVWAGSETSDYAPEDVPGLWERTDSFGKIWKYTLSLGKFHFITGYSVYKMLDGRFRAAPVFTFKFR
jgi:hypothetical protein